MGGPAKKDEGGGGWFGFGKKPVYDRRTILEEAAKAQGKGNRKKAITEYRKVLEMEPENPTLLVKLAVLLAETRQPEEAWATFTKAAELFRKDGMQEKWSSVWTQAVLYFPKSPDAWMKLAEAKLAKGIPADAAATLVTGARNFTKRKAREDRLRLLKRAFELTPLAHDVTMLYTKTLAASGKKGEARKILEDLATVSGGKKLRIVRGRLFRMGPTPAAGWRWLKAAVGKR